MRIDESSFEILNKVSKITLTDYGIKWFDAENIDGYIDADNLMSAIEDLLVEIEYLNEKLEDAKQPTEDYEDPYSYEKWEEQKMMEECRNASE
jgi:hypothetical protein